MALSCYDGAEADEAALKMLSGGEFLEVASHSGEFLRRFVFYVRSSTADEELGSLYWCGGVSVVFNSETYTPGRPPQLKDCSILLSPITDLLEAHELEGFSSDALNLDENRFTLLNRLGKMDLRALNDQQYLRWYTALRRLLRKHAVGPLAVTYEHCVDTLQAGLVMMKYPSSERCLSRPHKRFVFYDRADRCLYWCKPGRRQKHAERCICVEGIKFLGLRKSPLRYLEIGGRGGERRLRLSGVSKGDQDEPYSLVVALHVVLLQLGVEHSVSGEEMCGKMRRQLPDLATEDCVRRDVCTYAVTGEQRWRSPQLSFWCRTCYHLEDDVQCVCGSCARKCHAGHQLSSPRYSDFVCHC